MNNRFTSTVLSILCALLAVGCSQPSDSGEDDHHTEHFVPHHKPANFAEAVDQLDQRAAHLAMHGDDEADSHVQTEIVEFQDIAAWIPELAADSDLNESDWTIAAAAGGKIGELFVGHKESGNAWLKQLPENMQPYIDQLRPLIPKAGTPEPAIGHRHEGEGHVH